MQTCAYKLAELLIFNFVCGIAWPHLPTNCKEKRCSNLRPKSSYLDLIKIM